MIKVPKRALQLALLTASKDVTRPHLYGVHLERTSDGARVVSTDGHRMTVVEYDEVGEELRSLPLPNEIAFAPSWLLDAAKQAFLDRDAHYIGDNRIEPVEERDKNGEVVRHAVQSISFVADTLSFPSWRQMIPLSSQVTVSFDPAAVKMMKRSFTGDRAVFVFGEGGEVRFVETLGEATQDLGVVGKVTSGAPLDPRITINGTYFRDVLKAMNGGDVTLGADGASDPVIFRGAREGLKSVTVVVMPMRG